MENVDKDFMFWIIEQALNMGADEVECFYSRSKSYFVQIMAGQVRQPIYSVEAGFGIRVVVDKKIGFASTNIIDRERVIETISKAISIARASESNPKWVSLPEEDRYPSVKNIFDKRVVELGAEEVLDRAKEMLSASIEIDKRVIPVWGGVSASTFQIKIANSNNLFGEYDGTMLGGNIGVIARDGLKTTPIHSESKFGRTIEINFSEIGSRAAEKALKSLETTKISTGDYPAILAPESLSMLLMFTIIRSLEADFVQMGRSPFANKIGEAIASEHLTILDDGTIEGGLLSAPFDDEGSPMMRKVLVDKGVLRGFMYDNYTAKIENKKSTGNGMRVGVWFSQAQPNYQLTPTVSPTNLMIESGNSKLEDIIEEISEGILVLNVQGAHSSNPETGEVSVVATPAWKIENGEIKGLVQGLMMNMNIYQSIKQIENISKERKWVFNMLLPWIKLEKTKFISK